MNVRPSRIDQVIPSIIEHDAVSNHTFAAQQLLRQMGYESEIYASIIGPGCAGRVQRLVDLPQIDDGTQWVLYQCSIGSPAADVVARHPGKKLLDYHNITPADLVERWIPPLADESRLGRTQLGQLAPLCSYAFADSSFNASELIEVGFANAIVVPVLVERANIDGEADELKTTELESSKAHGGADWLFVGQIGAHKAQHDVVRAFYCFRRIYDPLARLHLVGREMGSAYPDALGRFVDRLGLTDVVDMPGSVSAGELGSYYAVADIFVCCSDHEGFCAPIIEAMSHGVPVVAYSAAAVRETVGMGGILLDDKRPATVASVVHEVLIGPTVRAQMIDAGCVQAATYTVDRAQTAFRGAIEAAVSNG